MTKTGKEDSAKNANDVPLWYSLGLLHYELTTGSLLLSLFRRSRFLRHFIMHLILNEQLN